MTSPNRQPKGIPTGGQFAASARNEPTLTLDTEAPRRSKQTTAPIRPLKMDVSPRRARGLYEMIRDGDLDLAPPYQRGSVWSTDQKEELIRSFLSRTPVPAVVLNNRGPAFVCIDGRQRIEAVTDWYSDRLAVPASWFPAEDVEATIETDDGPYVTYSGLSRAARADFNQSALLPVAEASLPTEADEAATYLRVNGAGTAQTEADMANAARVAGRG